MAEVAVTNHAKYRFIERGISVHEAKKIAKSGQIINREVDGALVKNGICNNGKLLTVVSVKEANKIIIKTAYYEN